MKNILIGFLSATCFFLFIGATSNEKENDIGKNQVIIQNESDIGKYQAIVHNDRLHLLNTETGQLYKKGTFEIGMEYTYIEKNKQYEREIDENWWEEVIDNPNVVGYENLKNLDWEVYLPKWNNIEFRGVGDWKFKYAEIYGNSRKFKSINDIND